MHEKRCRDFWKRCSPGANSKIKELQQRRERAYRAWYGGEMKPRTARRIIERMNEQIERVYMDMLEMALNELESYRKEEKKVGPCEPLRELLLRRESVPAPCVTVDGKPTKEWSIRQWYEKINSEVLEAYAEAVRKEKINSYNVRSDKEPRELIDVITVCYSRLHAIGYGEHEIMQMQRLTNRKNEERGRLE